MAGHVICVDDKRLTAGWFGMTKQPTMAFIGQWNLWVGEARTKEELALEPGEYWRSKDKSYPLLYKLGLWYAAIPLSAVSAERAIGLMREVETPKRNRMKKASWHAECFLRYNKWLTEGIFDDVSGDVATLQKCRPPLPPPPSRPPPPRPTPPSEPPAPA